MHNGQIPKHTWTGNMDYSSLLLAQEVGDINPGGISTGVCDTASTEGTGF